jgi:xylose isomerase
MSTTQSSIRTDFKFSVGPWNLHSGADPFGPPVRDELPFARKLDLFKKLGFDFIQFHDDDAVPDDVSASARERIAGEIKKMLDDAGLKAEFVAPRLWEDARGVDGPVTSNTASDRQWALERGKRSIDVARLLGTENIVWWPAREGTYIREAKDAQQAFGWMLDWTNTLLEYGPEIRILGEMKPNEPMDQMYLPTPGHFLAFAHQTNAPERVGVLIESAHAILAGLDPSDEMEFALFQNKLWGVHINDQNGLKYDQDKVFGAVDLRRAWNQVDVLVRGGFGQNGEVVGIDVKAMRTQKGEAFSHLRHSKEVFLDLVELSHNLNRDEIQALRAARDYEGLERLIIRALRGQG